MSEVELYSRAKRFSTDNCRMATIEGTSAIQLGPSALRAAPYLRLSKDDEEMNEYPLTIGEYNHQIFVGDNTTGDFSLTASARNETESLRQ